MPDHCPLSGLPEPEATLLAGATITRLRATVPEAPMGGGAEENMARFLAGLLQRYGASDDNEAVRALADEVSTFMDVKGAAVRAGYEELHRSGDTQAALDAAHAADDDPAKEDPDA